MTAVLAPPARVLDLEARARLVAAVAARSADDVDARARFPTEAVAALREHGLLAAGLPAAVGGEGADLGALARVTTVLGAACTATAMIYAMHQGQALTLARHGAGSEGAQRILRRIADDGALLASVTTEVGTGGNVRASFCAVTRDDDGRVHLAKTAPVVSYGDEADAFLVTARRTAESAPSDQVLAVVARETATIERTSEPNLLGMRGTCSAAFQLTATIDPGDVLEADLATISAESMLPVTHVLWAAAWLGLATEAIDRAGVVLGRSARRSIGILPPSATRFADLVGRVAALSATVESAAARFDAIRDDPAALGSVSATLAFNSVKVTASDAVVGIVSEALLVSGTSGYRLDSPDSLGRLLRDAFGTQVMVNNDLIRASNAQLSLLRSKGVTR